MCSVCGLDLFLGFGESNAAYGIEQNKKKLFNFNRQFIK